MYLFGYTPVMEAQSLLGQARVSAGLGLAELAAAAGTSRPTLWAYEHGRKSPTLRTATRIVGAAGFELTISPTVGFAAVCVGRGRSVEVPSVLPRQRLAQAFRVVELPLHLNWSDRGRRFDLRDRRQRARVYELVIVEGGPADVLTFIDGALLVDLWDELVLPAAVRLAWDPVVRGGATERVAG